MAMHKCVNGVMREMTPDEVRDLEGARAAAENEEKEKKASREAERSRLAEQAAVLMNALQIDQSQWHALRECLQGECLCADCLAKEQ